MPTELTQEQLAKIHSAIFGRRQIEAIKLYREFRGVGLAEAKDAVEKLSTELEAQEPTKFAPKPKGCAAVVLFLGVALAILFWLVASVRAGESPTQSNGVPTVDEALAAKHDIWGEAALRQPGGPSYGFFKKLLPPLRYVDAAFRFYPIVLSAPNAPQKARLVSNGSAINAKAVLKTWNEIGVPVTFRVGEDQQIFGEDPRRLDGPHLFKSFLPIVQLSYAHEDTIFCEESFASVDPALANNGIVFVQFSTEDRKPGKISAAIDSATPLAVSGGAICDTNGRAWVWFSPEWQWDAAQQKLIANLNGKKSALLAIATKASAATKLTLTKSRFAAERKKSIAAWQSILNRTMQVEVPEKIVNDAWRTLLVNNFALVDGDRAYYSAGNAYKALYEAECGDAVRAFLLWGLPQESTKMLKPLMNYTRKGLEFHNAGFKLQTLSHFYWLTRDTNWLEKMRPDWTRETGRILHGREADSGLLPRERYCGDIGTQVYSLHSNGACWRGLRDFAAVLADVGEMEKSKQLADTAREYRLKLLAATGKSERLDTQPPFIPIALFGEEKPYEVLTASMMGSYWNLIAPYLLGSELFFNSDREKWIIEYLHEHGGICMGMIRFDQHSGLFANHESVDDLYGLRYVMTLLRRDEVDRALISFYGKLAQGLTPETFIGAEGTRLKPEDAFGRAMYLPPVNTAQALLLWQLRYMLVQDWDLNDDGKPETLRLLFATPKNWLRDGAEIKVQHAPTSFGEISMRVRSRLNHGEVVAEIEAPQRQRPEKMLLRIRLPDGWKIISANCGAKKFLADEKGTIDISPLTGKFTIRFAVGK